MSRPIRFVQLFVLLALVGAVGWFVWDWTRGTAWRPKNPELIEPRLALATLKGPVIYTNGPGLEWLERQKPAFLPPRENHTRLAQATQDAQLFRKLDREKRFDEVWLLGEPSSFKPLLDHL